ncbi:pollen-specific leucine-rich repeat extensin-like protein 1 [Hibiscus syriacus]|uniref:pollen-specific leucine-rich repeat extensin-like protein 1 n=1 Tax=Hibiscus syriacus TaxID=106335 RepID=UPI0019224821|nr:pollen-specific leucine-rich repeat extensin-like protein 1 [Hibiscus syriacus]
MEDPSSKDRKYQNQNQPPPPSRNVEQPEKNKQLINGVIPSKHDYQHKQHRSMEDPPSKDRQNKNQPLPTPRKVEQEEKDRQPPSKHDHKVKQHRPMENPPSKDLKNQNQNQPPPPPARMEQPENDRQPFNIGVTPSRHEYLPKQYLPIENIPSIEPKKQNQPPPQHLQAIPADYLKQSDEPPELQPTPSPDPPETDKGCCPKCCIF